MHSIEQGFLNLSMAYDKMKFNTLNILPFFFLFRNKMVKLERLDERAGEL